MFPSLVPADPVALLRDGNMSKVPVLIGSNSGEGILNAGDYIKRFYQELYCYWRPEGIFSVPHC